MTDARSPGLLSALGRCLQVLLGFYLLIGVGQNVVALSDSEAHIFPSERTMPGWGSLVVLPALVVGIVMLGLGWVARRRRVRPHAVSQGSRVFAMLVLALWSVALLGSQFIFWQPEYTPEGDEVIRASGSLGVFADGLAGLIALTMAAVLARDGVALSRVGARAQVEAPSKTG